MKAGLRSARFWPLENTCGGGQAMGAAWANQLAQPNAGDDRAHGAVRQPPLTDTSLSRICRPEAGQPADAEPVKLSHTYWTL
jgi:hypothetical protein